MNSKLHELLHLVAMVNETTIHDVGIEFMYHLDTIWMASWNGGYESDTPADRMKINLWMDSADHQIETVIDMLLETIATGYYAISDYDGFNASIDMLI